MNLSQPLAVVTPTLDAAVLQTLAATTGWTTGGEVHRRCGEGSRDGVRRVLLRLVDQGIVLAQQEPYATLFLLNRDHVSAEALLSLTRVREVILTRVQATIADWSIPPVNASIFGSFARGEADAESDIDILIVGPESLVGREDVWADQLDQLARDVQRWTGNQAHIVAPNPATLAQMIAADDPLVASWRADHVPLWGANLLEHLRRAS